MTKRNQMDLFFELLISGPSHVDGDVFNPWADYDPVYDSDPSAPSIRVDNLRRYLEPRVGQSTVALIAEAPSYSGAKFCGIAMCCERMLLTDDTTNSAAYFPGGLSRTSAILPGMHNEYGMVEKTASVVWRTMRSGGYRPFDWVTWNAFAWHPHEAGNRLSNRTPTRKEVIAASPVLKSFISLFDNALLVSVGRVCQNTMSRLGIPSTPVRHPSYGGAPEFQDGIRRIRNT